MRLFFRLLASVFVWWPLVILGATYWCDCIEITAKAISPWEDLWKKIKG